MSLVELPTAAPLSKDIRGDSVDRLRAKTRRVKYRRTNANLLGTPKGFTLTPLSDYSGPIWNHRNAFKMNDVPSNRGRCSCCWDYPIHAPAHKILRNRRIEDYPLQAGRKTAASSHRGACPKFRRDPNDVDDDDDYGMSYSATLFQADVDTQCALADAVTMAVEKFETKELEGLVRNEYEVVATPQIDADDFVLV